MKYIKLGGILLVTLMLASCHKTCTCTGYDGREVTYSASEVNDRGVTCANMVIQAG